jgi:hypothetical protein
VATLLQWHKKGTWTCFYTCFYVTFNFLIWKISTRVNKTAGIHCDTLPKCFLLSKWHVVPQSTHYSHVSLNDGDTFWEMRRLAISSLCEHHRMYLTETLKSGIDLPPYGWKSFQVSVSRIGRFHPYWRFALASNFPPTVSLSEVSKNSYHHHICGPSMTETSLCGTWL